MEREEAGKLFSKLVLYSRYEQMSSRTRVVAVPEEKRFAPSRDIAVVISTDLDNTLDMRSERVRSGVCNS